jgi:hypothetical protein
MKIIGDKITLEVKTTFGIAVITFEVILIRPNHCYLLYAQDRIILGQEKAGGEQWVLSSPIDLFGIQTISDIYHKAVKP